MAHAGPKGQLSAEPKVAAKSCQGAYMHQLLKYTVDDFPTIRMADRPGFALQKI